MGCAGGMLDTCWGRVYTAGVTQGHAQFRTRTSGDGWDGGRWTLPLRRCASVPRPRQFLAVTDRLPPSEFPAIPPRTRRPAVAGAAGSRLAHDLHTPVFAAPASP